MLHDYTVIEGMVRLRYSIRVIIGAMLLLTGCVTPDANMKHYMGKTMADVVAKNGVPFRSMMLPDGNTVYTWQNGGCRWSYTANEEQVIHAWSYNNCRPDGLAPRGYLLSGSSVGSAKE